MCEENMGLEQIKSETLRCFRVRAKRCAGLDLSKFSDDELWKLMWEKTAEIAKMKCPACGKDREDEVTFKVTELNNAPVTITKKHAQDLSELVEWFKKRVKGKTMLCEFPDFVIMSIGTGKVVEIVMKRCDEFLEDLRF